MKAFLFPGQGSQKLKMGLDLYENFNSAKQVFEEVDDALKIKLSAIIFGDDAEALNSTENTQPALLATSIAILKIIETESGKKINELTGMVCGHSLGEYSALVASNAITLTDGVKLLKKRGAAMAAAAPEGQGKMMAIIGMTPEQVSEICANSSTDTAKCSIANDNSIGQIVISGDTEAILTAQTIATDMGAKKCVILPVSIPAHCQLMEPARKIIEEDLKSILISEPIIPFVSNRSANTQMIPPNLQDDLAFQMTHGVRFRECIDFMVDRGVSEFYEIGSGNVLSGLVKRTTEKATCAPIGTLESVKDFITKLQGE